MRSAYCFMQYLFFIFIPVSHMGPHIQALQCRIGRFHPVVIHLLPLVPVVELNLCRLSQGPGLRPPCKCLVVAPVARRVFVRMHHCNRHAILILSSFS